MDHPTRTTIDISTSTFIRVLAIILGLFFLFAIRDILLLLFIVLIFVAGLSPTIDRWSKAITRPGAVIAVFFIVLIALILAGSVLFPPLISQIQEFAINFPALMASIGQHSQTGIVAEGLRLITQNINNFVGQLGNFGGVIINQTIGVFTGLVAMATVIVITFYLLVDEQGWKKFYKGIVPAHMYDAVTETTRKIAGKLGAWLRGQLFLMLVVGAFTALGLAITGTPYALTLGVLAGLLEVIPIIGPWLATAVGVVVALAVSPLHGLLALIVYVVVQQLEGHILVPKIMSRAVGLNPVIVIVAILIGSKLFGFMGILLGVPAAAVISVIIEDWSLIQETLRLK